MTGKYADEIAVLVQILAPEIDHMFTEELKTNSFGTIRKLGVAFGYQHFPGVKHACFTRGNPKKAGEGKL